MEVRNMLLCCLGGGFLCKIFLLIKFAKQYYSSQKNGMKQ